MIETFDETYALQRLETVKKRRGYRAPCGLPEADASRTRAVAPPCERGRARPEWRAAGGGFLGARGTNAVRWGRSCACRCGTTIEAKPLSGQTCPIEPAKGPGCRDREGRALRPVGRCHLSSHADLTGDEPFRFRNARRSTRDRPRHGERCRFLSESGLKHRRKPTNRAAVRGLTPFSRLSTQVQNPTTTRQAHRWSSAISRATTWR
ncbi:hypothetical protein EDC40_108223 [Aminobacter aminovorans]|uniref:Uncharacterized protein n=1 Tax=Aminobacter aminovorans TaxID=83263 RepID=A0A381IMP8_AMIAI|nr:hypothetical protein EDC40_108223 [Aminobacter aminovorans]SUY29241.1 Uncharacterised protein [Aminobacter aminovorans]